MEVFVSSLISGMEEDRAAVRRAIERLGHRAVMAEDFGARPDSPQVAGSQSRVVTMTVPSDVGTGRSQPVPSARP